MKTGRYLFCKKSSERNVIIIQKEFKIEEIYDLKEKNIEAKLNEAFIIFLTEKLISTINTKEYKNPVKDIEKSYKKTYNRNSWIGGAYCYRKEQI